MSAFFVDSSAIVKCYMDERGSEWMRAAALPDSGNDVFISRLASVEIVSSIARRSRSLTDQDAAALYDAVKFDVDNLFSIVEFNEGLATSAMAIARTYGLRALDAIQLSSALKLQSLRSAPGLPTLTFITADGELAAAAVAVGFKVIDPSQQEP
ncbi:MAG: nucleic acid-binding protein [Planctomycetota bacterium]|nr:MAG: nucleic acid-binding protein [Planctomycetota bacterium]